MDDATAPSHEFSSLCAGPRVVTPREDHPGRAAFYERRRTELQGQSSATACRPLPSVFAGGTLVDRQARRTAASRPTLPVKTIIKLLTDDATGVAAAANPFLSETVMRDLAAAD